MFLSAVTGNAQLIVASMAAVSAFSAFIVVSWPYLLKDTLCDRMRQIAEEREAIRTRERARLQSGKTPLSLRTKPKQVFKNIFDWMNLAKQAEDGKMVKMLRTAGYRGQGPVVTFVAIRLIMPLAEAVQRLPERVPVSEASFFAIVIAIQSRTGGNLSEALGNLSTVLRERKKMQSKSLTQKATAWRDA